MQIYEVKCTGCDYDFLITVPYELSCCIKCGEENIEIEGYYNVKLGEFHEIESLKIDKIKRIECDVNILDTAGDNISCGGMLCNNRYEIYKNNGSEKIKDGLIIENTMETKIKMLEEISEWYSYDLEIRTDKSVYLDGGEGFREEFENITDALIWWLGTLEDSTNEEWEKQITYIKKLIERKNSKNGFFIDIVQEKKGERISTIVEEYLEDYDLEVIEYDGNVYDVYHYVNSDERDIVAGDLNVDGVIKLIAEYVEVVFNDFADEIECRVNSNEDYIALTGKSLIRKNKSEDVNEVLEYKVFKVVKKWLDDYSYEILETSKGSNSLNMKVEDKQYTDEDEKIQDNDLDYWCKFFIESIDYKISAGIDDEEVEKEWLEEIKIMQQYLNRSKQNEEVVETVKDKNGGEANTMKTKLDLGKKIADVVVGEPCFDYVEWKNIKDSLYEELAESLMLEIGYYNELVEYWKKGDCSHPSYDLGESYDYIKERVEMDMMFGYSYDDKEYVYVKDKTIEGLADILNKNGIFYNTRYDIDDEKDGAEIYIEIALDEDYSSWIDIKIIDNQFYIIKSNSNTDEKIATYEELIKYLIKELEITQSEEDVAMDMVATDTVQMKYDVKLEVVENNGDAEYTVKSNLPISVMTNEDKVIQIDHIDFWKQDGEFRIRQVFKGYSDIVAFRSQIKYLIGIDSEELLETCHQLCADYAEIPYSYMKIDGKYYEVTNLKDFLDVLRLGIPNAEKICIVDIEYKFNGDDSELLTKIMEDYDYDDDTLLDLMKGTKECMDCCDGNRELFKYVAEQVVEYDFDEFNSSGLKISSHSLQNIAKEYVSEKFKIPDNLVGYVDYESFFKDNVEYNKYIEYIIVKL